MPEPILLLGPAGSRFCARVGDVLRERGIACAIRSQDAVSEGRPITLAPGRVEWDGIDLRLASCVFLERPVFLWPQSGRTASAPPGEPRLRTTAREREARALTVSALSCARRLVNPVQAASLAASRPTALTALAAAGLPVHPWRVAPAPAPGQAGASAVHDLVGGDAWHRARRPPAGDLCLAIDPAPGAITGLLVTGARASAAVRFGSSGAWEAGRGAEPIDPSRLPAAMAETACGAAAALHLDFLEVWLAGPEAARGACAVLMAEAGPDLDSWETISQGKVAPGVVDQLVDIACRGDGETS